MSEPIQPQSPSPLQSPAEHISQDALKAMAHSFRALGHIASLAADRMVSERVGTKVGKKGGEDYAQQQDDVEDLASIVVGAAGVAAASACANAVFEIASAFKAAIDRDVEQRKAVTGRYR